MKRDLGHMLRRSVLYLCMALLLFAIFAPLYWLFVSSISTRSELLNVPPHWIPQAPTLQNYLDILAPTEEASRASTNFRFALGNSVIVAATVTVISLFFGSLAAYAFARLRFPYRQTGLYIYLSIRMLPAISLVIPLYIILRDASLLNTTTALVLVYLSFVLPFVLYIMVSFFLSIPHELEDAARVDGCSRFGVLWRIILPISAPGLVAAGIFAFLLSWDEFFYALLFTSTPIAKTVPVALAEFTGRNATDYPAQSAAAMLALIPPVVLVLIFQRFIVSGLTSGAVKG
ncbi:MAG: carbohydrate ABC transporter permease [Chitinophagaceae bacterium]|nr:carbohydrate ABC transporter permease [Anaerolineae bacterium]